MLKYNLADDTEPSVMVWCRWEDPCTGPRNAHTPSELGNDYLIDNVGWLLRADEKYVVLSMEYLHIPKCFRNSVQIPTSLIRSMRVLCPYL